MICELTSAIWSSSSPAATTSIRIILVCRTYLAHTRRYVLVRRQRLTHISGEMKDVGSICSLTLVCRCMYQTRVITGFLAAMRACGLTTTTATQYIVHSTQYAIQAHRYTVTNGEACGGVAST